MACEALAVAERWLAPVNDQDARLGELTAANVEITGPLGGQENSPARR